MRFERVDTDHEPFVVVQDRLVEVTTNDLPAPSAAVLDLAQTAGVSIAELDREVVENYGGSTSGSHR
jgi:hypothetical protein